MINKLIALTATIDSSKNLWRGRLLALFSGLMAAAALPPVYGIVLLIPAFVVLFKLLETSTTGRKSFFVGWWFGLGHFAAGLYWVSYAFMVEASLYGWLAPVAVIFMAAGMALFTGVFSYLVFISNRYIDKSAARVFVFAAIWVLVEWLRGWILTGFPWNLMGTVWGFSDTMMQSASLFGLYGLSLFTVFLATIPVLILKPGIEGTDRGVVLAGLVGLLILIGFGVVRLSLAENTQGTATRLRLVQPNVPQKLKWKRELRARHVRNLIELSQQPAIGKPPTVVIWPEAAVPYDLANTQGLKQAIATVAPKNGYLLVGAPKGSPRGQKPFKIWNSLFAIKPGGAVAATYDKAHLVPFGEYLPFRNLIGDKFGKLTAGRSDFSAGPGPQTINLDGLPSFSPLICYEVIFPDAVTDKNDRPEWLLNLTNDAWFGLSAGPYQHLMAARFRSVEQGMPLVRVANTGITVATDAYGQILGQIDLGEQGIVDVDLAAALKTLPLYARFGNAVPGVLVVLFLGLGLLLGRDKAIKS